MSLPAENWRPMRETIDMYCKYESMKKHWIKVSGKEWPGICSVSGCNNPATIGAHLVNQEVKTEIIIPLCDACNQVNKELNLKSGTTVVMAALCNSCKYNPYHFTSDDEAS